jgi:putative MATE family efflux protein
MVGNNAIRATGDTKTASMIMLVAVAVNLILDPLLIFGIGPFPELGIAGAAIATVTARFSTLAVSLWVLALRERMLTFRPPQMQEVVDSWKEILFIGLPTAATNMINPLAIGIITSLVATYGAAAVAGFGAATRIDMFAMTVIMAMSSVLGPFVGQNWGAGLRDRVDLAIKYAQRFALLWGLAVFVLLLLVREPLARVFNDNPDVIATMALYLAIVPIGYGFKGTVLLSSSVLNVLRKPLHASALILAQLIVLYIPLAYLGSYLFGLTGIFVAAAFANILVGTVSYRWLRRFIDTIENQRAPLPQQPPDGIAEEGSLPEAGRA